MAITPENRVAADQIGQNIDWAVQTKVAITKKEPDVFNVPAAPRFAPTAATGNGIEFKGIDQISAPQCKVVEI